MTTPRHRALLLTLISLFLWEAWEGLRVFPDPWGDLKGANYTDHFSHMNAARAFPELGLDIWRRGYDKVYRRLTPDEVARLPADVAAGGSYSGGIFAVPGWPADKPLVSSWTNNPRNYPPGDLVLVAPVATLYAHTDLPFHTANRLLLMLFLLYAHVGIFWLLDGTLAEAPATRALTWLRRITAAIVYFEVIHWTLEGFYDAAALAPLILCARFVGQRRGLPAIAAFCVAAVIHFRSYFFAPWAIYALVIAIRERQWRTWRLGSVGLLALSAVCGAISLGVFAILWPSLQHLPIHSRVSPSTDSGLVVFLLPLFLVLMASAAVVLWRARAWLDVAVLGWLTLMMVALHEAYPWHMLLAVLPWLCAPPSVTAPAGQVRVLAVRLFVLLAAICLVFSYEPFSVWNLWPL